jgi:hypothetical protein
MQAMTGEVRPESGKTDNNLDHDANHGGQQADDVRAAPFNAAFRLPIGPESAYPALNQRHKRRSYGKCRFKLFRDIGTITVIGVMSVRRPAIKG